jgi:sugar-specific transcriptional regulator TrmB
MLNKIDDINQIQKYLTAYGLSSDESRAYIALLEKPLSHLELARKTGINRTKIYRIADDLEKRSLIKTEQLDSGKLLSASEPKNLEVELVSEEQNLANKRAILSRVIPTLEGIHRGDQKELQFKVSTYEGVSGFKQMLWNELKTNGEILIFGSGGIEDLVISRRWSEAHRAKTVDLDYKVREINNFSKKPIIFTENDSFVKRYNRRVIDEELLDLGQQITIYNDTVGVFHFRDGQKVGMEIQNRAYANTMRQMFESYWKIAKELKS